MNYKQYLTSSAFCLLSLLGCASAPDNTVEVDRSYLSHGPVSLNKEGVIIGDEVNTAPSKDDGEALKFVDSLNLNKQEQEIQSAVRLDFSESKNVAITSEELLTKDFVHYVFGDLFKVNYILDQQVKADKNTITLNVQNEVSERKLFDITENLLARNQFLIRKQDDIFYIHKNPGAAAIGNVVYGYGRKISDVPNTNSTIVQLVPFEFGMQTTLANNLRKIVNISATPDFERSAIILQGKRSDILKAIEFIQLMDQPKLKNRVTAIYQANFVSTTDLVEQLPLLLAQEGLSTDISGKPDKTVSLVPLERIGSLVIFANNMEVVERVAFWANKLDQAPSGNQLQYFLYSPKFARASDLGQSLQPLIGTVTPQNRLSNSTSVESENNRSLTTRNDRPGNVVGAVASGDNIKMVVDERANSIIFHTSGDQYQQLLPLIKRLDVMPKQVLLEVMIAEVTLTDTFKQGVEFVLTNQNPSTTPGGFNLSRGAGGLTYALSGADGSLTVNLFQSNKNVNVLSRPSLLVRDGVSATIKVGDDIPTVGEVVTDPVNGSITSVVYRKTGVDLKVQPTINARGVILMNIDQQISNQSPSDDSVANSPVVFERSISTEVVAESGQTIVLGGLISDNVTINDTSVPFFSSIPVIGSLFDTDDDEKIKTELVVLVTPRVIEAPDEWEDILDKFQSSFNNLKLN